MAAPKNSTQNTRLAKRKHDTGYKSFLSVKKNAKRFIERYVHETWAQKITLDSLELVNKSFVTEKFKALDSDVIYKVNIGKSSVYFYFLIELQSKVDFTMPFRFLKYMVALLDEIFKNTPEKKRALKSFKLPAIVPIVLYNGDDNWTAVKRFREYTLNSEIFGDSIIDFRYLVFDVKRTNDSALSSPEQLLDAVFSFDKERLLGNISPEKFIQLWEKKANKLPKNDQLTLFSWVLQILYKDVENKEIKEIFETTIKKGDKNAMKHSLEVYAERMEKRLIRNGRKEKALEVAKKMRAKGKNVNEIAEFTDLTVDAILRL